MYLLDLADDDSDGSVNGGSPRPPPNRPHRKEKKEFPVSFTFGITCCVRVCILNETVPSSATLVKVVNMSVVYIVSNKLLNLQVKLQSFATVTFEHPQLKRETCHPLLLSI